MMTEKQENNHAGHRHVERNWCNSVMKMLRMIEKRSFNVDDSLAKIGDRIEELSLNVRKLTAEKPQVDPNDYDRGYKDGWNNAAALFCKELLRFQKNISSVMEDLTLDDPEYLDQARLKRYVDSTISNHRISSVESPEGSEFDPDTMISTGNIASEDPKNRGLVAKTIAPGITVKGRWVLKETVYVYSYQEE